MSQSKLESPEEKAWQYEQKYQKLKAIKDSLDKTINERRRSSTIDGDYRFKVTKTYREQLRTVFRPKNMDNYNEIQNFESNFQSYVRNDRHNLKTQEINESYVQESVKDMSRKGVYANLLTLDVDQLCQLSAFKGSKGNNLKISNPQKCLSGEKIITLPKILNNRTLKEKAQKIYSSSTKKISIQREEKDPSISSPQRSYKRSISLKSSQNSFKFDLRKQRQYLRNKGQKSMSQNLFTPQQLIHRLNFYNSTNVPIHNFRMELSVFQQVLKTRYGNDIICSYFSLPNLLEVDSVCTFLNSILNCSSKEKQMLTFLTLDVNKDGFICEKDLFRIAQSIPPTARILEDIYQIVSSMEDRIRNSDLQQEQRKTKLPTEYLQNPKRSMYIKLFEKQSALSISKNEKKLAAMISVRDRYYSVCENTIDSSRAKIHFNKNSATTPKIIKVNFEMFQYIFMDCDCLFILDLLSFLRDGTFDEHEKVSSGGSNGYFVELLKRMSTEKADLALSPHSILSSERKMFSGSSSIEKTLVKVKSTREVEMQPYKKRRVKRYATVETNQSESLDSSSRSLAENNKRKQSATEIDEENIKRIVDNLRDDGQQFSEAHHHLIVKKSKPRK